MRNNITKNLPKFLLITLTPVCIILLIICFNYTYKKKVLCEYAVHLEEGNDSSETKFECRLDSGQIVEIKFKYSVQFTRKFRVISVLESYTYNGNVNLLSIEEGVNDYGFNFFLSYDYLIYKMKIYDSGDYSFNLITKTKGTFNGFKGDYYISY